MDSNLKLNLKKHFKNYEMLMVDIEGLYNKYRNLNGSLYHSPSGTYLKLSGTIPYKFSGFIYNAPVLIEIYPDYPFSAPSMFVVPTRKIKIVKAHPNVDSKGNVTLEYLNQWNHTSKLVHAVDALHKAFNRISPIYGSIPNKSPLSDRNSGFDAVFSQSMPQGLFEKYKLSDRDRNLVEHSHENIITNLKRNRENVIKQYKFDLNKYEVHRKMLMNWVYALLELNNLNLNLDEIEAKLENELDCEEMEKLEELHEEVAELVKNLTNANQVLSSLENEEFEIGEVVKFKDQNSQKLGELIVNEATCHDMLDFLHESYKKTRISTGSYVKEMRKLSHELFLSKLKRESLLD